MGKKLIKKKKDSALPKISTRKTILTGILEHSGIKVKISVKNPEDWVRFRDSYLLDSNKLWRDFHPFMEVGYLIGTPKTRKHNDQEKKDSLKIFSVIVYHFCKSIKEINQCPAFLKPLQNKGFDCKDVAASLMDSVFMDYLNKHEFGHAFGKMYKIKIKPFCDTSSFKLEDRNEKEEIATDNFYETYIRGGKKLLQNTDTKTLRKLIGETNHILHRLHMLSNISSVSYNKKAHKILQAISDALYIQFRDHINGTLLPPIGKRSIIELEDIEFVRDVLRPIFPALPIPDEMPLLIPDYIHPTEYKKYIKK